MRNTNKTLTLEIVETNKITYVKVKGGYKEAVEFINKHCPDCRLWTIKG